MQKLALLFELTGVGLILFSIYKIWGSTPTYMAGGIIAVMIGVALELTER